MSDYDSSGPLVRRAAMANPVSVPATNPADVYNTARAQHGQDVANKVRTTLEFLNGGPIDTTDTTAARQKRETGK